MIRKMQVTDRKIFYELTNAFYNLDCVLNKIPFDYHQKTFDEIIKSDAYLEGYLFIKNSKIAGYALTSKYYSHEAGGMTLFVDELYVKEAYRSQGLAKAFFKYLNENLDNYIVRLRLEVESENKAAIKLYNQEGFSFLNYNQMIKDR